MASTSELPKAHRTLYILVYPSRLFAAHWSLFLPDVSLDSEMPNRGPNNKGTRIHVTGDRLNGFVHEIVRDYNMKTDKRRPSLWTIGNINVQHLAERKPTLDQSIVQEEQEADDGGGITDNLPRNTFELVCLETEAPGPSLNKVQTGLRSGSDAPKKPEVKDCQWWIKQVTELLVQKGVLSGFDPEGRAEASPVKLISSLPMH